MDQNKILQTYGVVVAIKANYFLVKIDPKSATLDFTDDVISQPLLCKLRRRLIYSGSLVYVGDQVLLEAIDLKLLTATICDLKPRESLLTRPQVANGSDIILLLSAKRPAFDFDQASRFLLNAEQSGLNITLVLNKIDLIDQQELNVLIQRMEKWGYHTLPVSVKHKQGVDSLVEQLAKVRLSVLCGPSGVGKSSLLNTIFSDLSLLVQEVSGKLERGRHTTRHVELFELSGNSYIADTPGFNRPEFKIEPHKLWTLFPEFRTQLSNQPGCKFRDCLHLKEPGCVANKSWERYPQYQLLLEEMLNLNR